MLRIRGFITLLVVVLALSLGASAVMAQDGGEDDTPVIIEFTGFVELIADDAIIINGYTVAPAGAFIPAELEVGDEVMVIGRLLNDDTLQVMTLLIITGDGDIDGIPDVIDNCPEVSNPDQIDEDDNGIGDLCEEENCIDVEASDEEDCEFEMGDLVGFGDDDDQNDDEDGDDEDDTVCLVDNHPVAMSLADAFGVGYDTIMSWHCDDGEGFGNISRALLIGDTGAYTAEEVMAMLDSGESNWGQLKKDLRDAGYDMQGLNQGAVISGRYEGVVDGDVLQEQLQEQLQSRPGNSGNAPGQQDRDNSGNNGNGNSANAPGHNKDD